MARSGSTWYEKGVDVKIATDLVALAYQDRYDIAVLISGDGDLAPVVREVRRLDPAPLTLPSSLRGEGTLPV